MPVVHPSTQYRPDRTAQSERHPEVKLLRQFFLRVELKNVGDGGGIVESEAKGVECL